MDFVINNGVLESYSGNESSVVIPEGVTKIGPGAFKSGKFSSVKFSGTLKSIGANAFENCGNLKEIDIPDSVVQIEDEAFAICRQLKCVCVPDSAIVLGDKIFICCPQDLMIVCSDKSEICKYAKEHNIQTRSSKSAAAVEIKKNQSIRNAVKTKTFDIFGEKVKCSNSLPKHLDTVEYYSDLKDKLFSDILSNLPNHLGGSYSGPKITNLLDDCTDNLLKRLADSGIYETKAVQYDYTIVPLKKIATIVQGIVNINNEAQKIQSNEISNNNSRLIAEAESQVVGLSYGIIGDSLDMICYSIDDFRERNKQRKKAYAKAEQMAAAYNIKVTGAVSAKYKEILNKLFPLLKQTVDEYVDGLMKTELEQFTKANIIEKDAVSGLNAKKSMELIESILDSDGDNRFQVALALKMFPCNVDAYAYAEIHNYESKSLNELKDFLGLDKKVNALVYKQRKQKLDQLAAEIKKHSDVSCGIRLVEQSKLNLSDAEIKNMLDVVSNIATTDVRNIIDSTNSVINDVSDEYWTKKVRSAISEEDWKYLVAKGVTPLKLKSVPDECKKNYQELCKWITESARKSLDEKARKYEEFVEKLSKASTMQDYRELVVPFTFLGKYKGSEQKLWEINRKLEEFKKEEERQKAERKKRKIKNIAIFSASAIAVAAIFIIVLNTVILPSSNYKKALAAVDAGNYEEAYSMFNSKPDYKDTKDQIKFAKTKQANELLKQKKYDEAYTIFNEIGDKDSIINSKNEIAEALLKEKNYDDAYAILNEIGKTETINENMYARAIEYLEAKDYESAYALLEQLGETSKINESMYNCASNFLKSKDYDSAIALFTQIESYSDVSSKLENCYIGKYGKEKWNKIKSIKVGSTYTFGKYEQDNDNENGKEDIAWRVLAKEGNKILIISEYALDCQQYNTSDTYVTWENCSLRKWMNEDFYTAAFNKAEQSMIATTKVTADSNPNYSTNPGNDTTDKVFLLSIDEANKYFSSDEDRKCVPTAYAIENGAWTSDNYSKNGKATCWWWLRSPGHSSSSAADVSSDGDVFSSGFCVNYDVGCVRPALWIEI